MMGGPCVYIIGGGHQICGGGSLIQTTEPIQYTHTHTHTHTQSQCTNYIKVYKNSAL